MALLIRIQPATAYQISKTYAESPVSNFGTSKGKIYPLIRRLKERGLVTGRELAGDGRRSEVLSSTVRGRNAVRDWIRRVKPSHLLPEDPLRTMVQSFELLSHEERLQWVRTLRSALEGKLTELHAYGTLVHVPFKDIVHDNAVSLLEARLAWLDRVAAKLLTDKDARAGSSKARTEVEPEVG